MTKLFGRWRSGLVSEVGVCSPKTAHGARTGYACVAGIAILKQKGERMQKTRKLQKPRWYDRENWPYASDRKFVKECAWWLKEVNWQLFGTLTFAFPVSDEKADWIFTAFVNRLERVLRADVAYVCGSEKRFSGCGKPACGRHFHVLLASAAPMHSAIVKWLWQSLAGDGSDDAGAKVEAYDSHDNAAEYVLKYAPESHGEWKVRNVELFHPARGLLDLTVRSRRHLRRHKERQKKFRSVAVQKN
jgi:hypothetical protein